MLMLTIGAAGVLWLVSGVCVGVAIAKAQPVTDETSW